MKRRTRYLLLIIGFIFFLITAPLIVLYLSGITYDFSANHYVRTGIVVANTEPQNARIYIDDSLVDTSPARVKFVTPGEHDISLHKEGYFTWSKRLEIKSSKVTWVASDASVITLLRQDPPTSVWATDVIDFDLYKGGLVYLTATSLITAPDPESDTAVIPLPAPIRSFVLSPNREVALLYGEGTNRYLYNFNTLQLYGLGTLVTPTTELVFSATNELLSLDARTLSVIDYKTLTSQPIATNIASITTIENVMYALRVGTQGYELITFGRNSDPANAQVLATTPAFTTSQILVTKQKEIFILGNNSVYAVGTELTRLVDGVTSWQYYPDRNSILLASPSELHRYTLGAGLELISRSSTSFTAPLLQNNIGYAFYGQDGYLQALELDRRDHQNNYRLLPATDIKKILSKDNGKILFILDGGTVTELEIQ